ncbi:MAG TPA: hypothetical protein VLE02_02790 [Nitrosarchaeum sp.]|nr:hypothetical protein [Nitrosarchaeum sp.]
MTKYYFYYNPRTQYASQYAVNYNHLAIAWFKEHNYDLIEVERRNDNQFQTTILFNEKKHTVQFLKEDD